VQIFDSDASSLLRQYQSNGATIASPGGIHTASTVAAPDRLRRGITSKPIVSTLRKSVTAEELRLLVQSPLPVWAAMVVGVLTALVLRGALPPLALYGWAGAVLVLQSARYRYWRQVRDAGADDAAVVRAAVPITIILSATGLLWGMLSFGFYATPEAETRALILIVIASTAAGGSLSFTAYLPAHLGYVIGVAVPAVAAFVAHGTSASLTMAGVAASFLGLFVMTVRGANRGVANLIALKLENAALVADLRRARDTAEQANRVKSHFLANMSHELRTPLNAIIGFSDIIRNEYFGVLGNPRYHDYVGDIHRSGHHLLRLVNDVLDISKLEAGAMEISDDTVDLKRVVGDCVGLLRTPAAANGLSFAIDIPDAVPPILADELRMKQIVLNLLSNAVKFSRQGGTIAVTASTAPDGGLRLVVRDDGIGMNDDEIAIALQPFRQVESSLSRRTAGTGLGLPLAKTLIERHGGTLSVDSVRGVGTGITLTLPASRMMREPTRLDHAPAAAD
jgi:signal transduction histidine kinase